MGLFTRQTQRVLDIVKSTKLSDDDKYRAVGDILEEMYVEGGFEVLDESEPRGIPLDVYKQHLEEEGHLIDESLAVLVAPAGIDTEDHQAREFKSLSPAERETQYKQLKRQISDHTDKFYAQVAVAEAVKS